MIKFKTFTGIFYPSTEEKLKMVKLRKILEIGKSKIIKELDVIKMIKTIRNLKEFVKSIDGISH